MYEQLKADIKERAKEAYPNRNPDKWVVFLLKTPATIQRFQKFVTEIGNCYPAMAQGRQYLIYNQPGKVALYAIQR